ncbi:sensor histidine kinase [Aequorivita sp. CIP111184]|uniref:sensor histidine kinase n=1 Tax=Aequorivita sp. CIP111184 TaxID=2211356 RepID=UPI00215D2C0F|nr:sensor histidine kinase [Aequorivita sp. CIP111184]
MKIRYHILAQILLWAVVWLIMGLNQQNITRFLMANLSAFGFQVLLIVAASYFIAPKLLFQKKYAIFLVVSLAVVALSAYLSSELTINPPPRQGGLLGPNGPRPPSAYLIHLLLISVSYILSVLAETFLFAQKKEEAIAKQTAALAESELKFLKMQINPHFLFNSLNNIYALSISNSEKTPESIHSLSEMLRYVIYDCERPKVPIEKEIHYIENFIELFKLRSSKSFNITFINQLENTSVEVAPMLFIIFIENAFKHSGIEKGGEAFVDIKLQSSNNTITFSVENSLPTVKIIKDKSSGIGLQNAKKRLEISYPNQHDLNIENGSTFKVDLKLYADA